MKIYATENKTAFSARIKINKQKMYNSALKSTGEVSVTGGSSTVLSGASSGADMIVHGVPSAIPVMQHSSSLFDQFAQYGHKIFEYIFRAKYVPNTYDEALFSTSMTGSGSLSYSYGMDNIIEAIKRSYKNRIPN